MGSLGRDAIEFATRRSAKLAASAKGDWKKVAAFGAAAAIVFVVAAFGYAGLSKVRRRNPDDAPPNDGEEGRTDETDDTDETQEPA